MLYAAYEAQRVTLDGARAMSRAALETLDRLPPPVAELDAVRRLRAAHQVFVDSAITHERLPFGIGTTVVEGRTVAVHEDVVADTPFCTLLRFAKDLPDGAPPQPRVLLVAPLSGHFATLLTDTVRTMLPDHDVHITDWRNARDVGLEHGPFGLDELVDHVVEFLQVLGPRSHVVAVASSAIGETLATVYVQGASPYDFTGDMLAWSAERARDGGLHGTGALGPVEAFGLDALREGSAEAGITRV